MFNLKAFAGANLSVSTKSVTKGETFTVSVNMKDAAAWNIHVSSSGPVKNCSIAQADATADALDTSKTFTATCETTGIGTINITLSGDVTSAKDGEAVMLSGSASVKVVEPEPKPEQKPEPTPEPQPTPNIPQNNLSNNNNISNITVDGYNLNKIDDNNYTLSVSNNVTSININASAEDSKATVRGNGNHELNIGENNIEIVVVSESSWENKINIKVTRKDAYYLDDLDLALEDNKLKSLDIRINKDSKITKEHLSKIKQSGKQINFNYYNEEEKLIYSWILDGSKIETLDEFVTTISNESEEVKNISKLSNYADGLYINFEHNSKLPKGTKIKIYVGDKFTDGSIVNIYSYQKANDKLNVTKTGVVVQGGYIGFDIEDCNESFVTMSNLSLINKKSSPIIFIILSIVEFIIIISLLLIYFSKINKKDNSDKDVNINKSNNENNSEEIKIPSVGINTVERRVPTPEINPEETRVPTPEINIQEGMIPTPSINTVETWRPKIDVETRESNNSNIN